MCIQCLGHFSPLPPPFSPCALREQLRGDCWRTRKVKWVLDLFWVLMCGPKGRKQSLWSLK
jgi:hypothetical protein